LGEFLRRVGRRNSKLDLKIHFLNHIKARMLVTRSFDPVRRVRAILALGPTTATQVWPAGSPVGVDVMKVAQR
jgi:hypothetical protein